MNCAAGPVPSFPKLTPFPANVDTVIVATEMVRMTLFPVSAMNRLPVDVTAMPAGLSNFAVIAVPLMSPFPPWPAKSSTVAEAVVNFRILWFPVSEM